MDTGVMTAGYLCISCPNTEGVIDKVGNVYTMLNAAGEGHHEWIQVACMSSLLSQLQRIAEK